MSRPVPTPTSLAPLLFGAFLIWGFGFETVLPRLRVAVDGVVTRRTDLPAFGAARYSSAYVLRTGDGAMSSYIAGPTDASLLRGQPVGTRFRKRRWQLGYWLNDRWIAFPVIFYGLMLSLGTALLLVGACRIPQWRRHAR